MSTGVQSKNPRIRSILVTDHGTDACAICGKNSAKRKGAPPAPVHIVLEFAKVAFKNNFDAGANLGPKLGPPQFGVARCLTERGWKLGRKLRFGGALCLGCAKRLSSRLDAVIEQIESRYR